MLEARLLNKINGLRIYGDQHFAIRNGENRFEFKIIPVAGEPYILFAGNGIDLHSYSQTNSAVDILNDFKGELEKIGLSLDGAIFVDPMHFISKERKASI